MKKTLRIISGIMLVVAILFLFYAFMHPEGGSVFYILGVPIGSNFCLFVPTVPPHFHSPPSCQQ